MKAKNQETENKKLSISASDKLGLLSTMSTMLAAGIPILETIDSLTEDAKGNVLKILQAVRADLIQGISLSTSFARFPNVFDNVTVNIIKASEEAGTLDVVLKDVRNQIQKDMEFMDGVKSALAYPMIILIVFIGVMLVILVFVMPKIATVFSQLKANLPLPTQMLIFASNLIVTKPLGVLAGLAGIILMFVVLFHTQGKLIKRFVFSLPVISTLVKQIDLTRFSRSMYLLLASGITITSALELTEEVVLRDDVSKVIVIAKNTILSGKKLSDAFKQQKHIFPSILIKIIEAGEKTGTLEKSMQDIADYMDYQVSNSLKAITTLIEPIMLLIVGVLVGGMMMSIIAPIYGLISQVGSGIK